MDIYGIFLKEEKKLLFLILSYVMLKKTETPAPQMFDWESSFLESKNHSCLSIHPQCPAELGPEQLS